MIGPEMAHNSELQEKVLAFDVRIPRRRANADLPHDYRQRALLNPSVTTNALSVDETIWSQIERHRFDKLVHDAATAMQWPHDASSFCDSNDLLPKIPEKWLTDRPASINGDSCLIALSVTSVTADYLSSLRKHGLMYELTMDVEQLDRHGWRFLGYDVADKTLYSPLMNADLGRPGRESIAKQFRGKVNQNGLFSDLDAATEFAKVAEGYVPEHAPYFAIGIWSHPSNR
jgi:hypothetical protein